MNSIIIDKNLSGNSEAITKLKESYPFANTSIFQNYTDALSYLKETRCKLDLIVLDMNLPIFLAFDLLKFVKQKTKFGLTVDLGQSKQGNLSFFYDNLLHLRDDFDIVLLNKPLHYGDLKKIYDENNKSLQLNDSLLIYSNKQFSLRKYSEIFFIESKGDYVKINTNKENYIVYSTLKKMNNKLPENNFVRIHRSVIVNVNKVQKITSNSVVLSNEAVFPLSKTYRGSLIELVQCLSNSEYAY